MAKHIHIHLSAPKKTVDRKVKDNYEVGHEKGQRGYRALVRKNGRIVWLSAAQWITPQEAEAAARRGLEAHSQGKQIRFEKGTADSETQDSEENDAYIAGHKDGIEGKPQDPAYHPGGSKKPSVALKYAEGYKQGEKDRKNGGKTSDANLSGPELIAAESAFMKSLPPTVNYKGSVYKRSGKNSTYNVGNNPYNIYVRQDNNQDNPIHLKVYRGGKVKDSTFSGSERQWKNAVRDKHPGAIFRPGDKAGTLIAKDVKHQTIGEFNGIEQRGSVR